MAIPIRRSSPRNIIASERTFFVTSSIWEKKNLLQTARSAELFINVLYDYREQGKYLLHEFVVMPDHFHLLATIDRSMSIERAVQFIKGGFAFRAGRELGFRAPVWQKGFSETRITDPGAFERVREYIQQNPVRRHIVEDPRDFPYSSAHPGFVLDPPPQRLKPVAYADFVGMPKGMP